MKDFRIIFSGIKPISLPDGICLGVVGESNVVKLVLTLPESMVDGMDYHVVTIGGVDSARIVGTDVNIENAYRVGNVIYMPLSSAYTTHRIADLTVTAYKQTGDVVAVVDKTPTVYGLKFGEGQPRPADGGLASEVAAIENRVDGLESEVEAIRDDIPTAEEVAAWNEAAEERHTHANMDAINKIREKDYSFLAYDDHCVEIVEFSDLPTDSSALYPYPPRYVVHLEQGRYVLYTWVIVPHPVGTVGDTEPDIEWIPITSGLSPTEAAILRRFSVVDGVPAFDGKTVYDYVRDVVMACSMNDGVLTVNDAVDSVRFDSDGSVSFDTDSVATMNANNKMEVYTS